MTLAVFELRAQNTDQLATWFEEQDFERIIAATEEPTDPSSAMYRADAFHKIGAYKEAELAYDRAEKLGASGKFIFLNRGICRFSLGRYEASRDDLLEAHERDALESKIPYYLAAISYMQDEFKLALRYLEDALRLEPDYFDALYLQGAILLTQGKGASAEVAFMRCLELKRTDQRTRLNLAMTYVDQFRFEEARELLDELILYTEGDLLRDAYYHRGNLRLDDHDQLGACEDWSNAADLGDEMAEAHIQEVCTKGAKKIRKRKAVHVAF